VRIPAGRIALHARYEAPGLGLGAAISVGSLLLLGLLVVAATLRPLAARRAMGRSIVTLLRPNP